jgi:ribosomal protein S6
MVEKISREVDVAWLAGIIEGEGCLISRFYNEECRNNKRRGINLFVRIQIINNDAIIIQKTTKILSALGVGYYYQINKRKKSNHNDTLIVVVQGKGRVKKLLKAIMPYLSGKLKQAKFLKWIIERREEMAHCFDRSKRLSDDVILRLLIRKLKEAKHSLPINPSETTRRANYPLSW